MKKLFLLSAAAAFLFAGCITYDYQGKESGTPSTTVQICTDCSKIDKSKYTVLGTARVSGNSNNVSQSDLYEKLADKAKECGADVILVTAYQVAPSGSVHGESVNAKFDCGDSNLTWQQISRDVDSNYGNVRGNSGESYSGGSYVRIVQAEYLKRNIQKAAVPVTK